MPLSPQKRLTPHLVHVLVERHGLGIDVADVVATPRVRVKKATGPMRRLPQTVQRQIRQHILPVARGIKDRDLSSLRHTPSLRESHVHVLPEARVSNSVAIELRA